MVTNNEINQSVKQWNLPAWSFLPIKILLLLAYLIPIGVWVAHVHNRAGHHESVNNTDSTVSVESHHPALNMSALVKNEQTPLNMSALVKNEQTPLNNSVSKSSTSEETVSASAPVVTSSTAPQMIKGIDVSHYQGKIQWEQVAENDIVFGFAKATGGVSFIDPEFSNNWRGMRENEIYRGAYHFFNAADDPEKQADHYLETIGKLLPHDLPPVVDVETLDHVDASIMVKGVEVWLQKVEKKTGRRPIIYSDLSFAVEYLSDSRFAKYYFWVAEYSSKVGTLPTQWKETGWQFWQYSSTGNVLGISGDVDQDYFPGNLNQLRHFIEKSADNES